MTEGRGPERARLGWLILVALTALLWTALLGTCWAGNAILKVISDPEEAKVTVDSGQEGITPCVLEVPPGKRSLTIKAVGYLVKYVQVDVASGEATEVKVKLRHIPGTMRPGTPRYCQLTAGCPAR